MKGRFSIRALFNAVKDRIPGALLVVFVFVGSFVFLDGKWFCVLLIIWLTISYLELNVSETTTYFIMHGNRGNRKFGRAAKIAEFMVLLALLFSALTLGENTKLFAVGVYVCWISDTAGLLFGLIFGSNNRVKGLLAEISPKKSWAGFAGAILVPIPFIIWIARFMGISDNFSSAQIVTFACTAGLVAVIGDLLGSAAKRELGIKDSAQDFVHIPVVGNIAKPMLKGHGGFYDRADSISLQIIWVSLLFILAPS